MENKIEDQTNPFCNTSSDRIYLDHNATTPLASVVLEKLTQWAQVWGNPSSVHKESRAAKKLLRESRKKITSFIGSSLLETIFTSGGSESNNTVIRSMCQLVKSGGFGERNEFIFSNVEHPSVMELAKCIEEEGLVKVHWVKVDKKGTVDLGQYHSLLNEKTAFVSFMFANNETGNIFPIKEMVDSAHKVGALFHCDGTQALGKMIIDVKAWGVDFATFSGHKFYSLKGCGLLYVNSGSSYKSLIIGGAQERNRRAGTENLLAIASFSEMTEFKNEILSQSNKMRELRDFMESQIIDRLEGVSIPTAESDRLSNTSSIVVDGVNGETLLMNLDIQGVSVSTGAACSSGSTDPSPVLINMGYSRKEAQSTLRLSLGWGTTHEEITRFVEILVPVIEKLRRLE